MIKCPGCGRTYSNLVKVCPACKTALNSQTQELPQYGSSENSSTLKPQPNNAGVTCPNCGATVQGSSKFCGSCGGRVAPETPKTVQNTPAPAVIPVKVDTSSNSYQQSTAANNYQATQSQEDNIFKQYFKELTSFNFSGRLNRAKYWKFFFIGFGMMMALAFVLGALGLYNEKMWTVVSFVYSVLFLPFNVRRFHDLNRSGWWVLFSLIPFINLIVGIYAGFFKGTDGPNQYGPDPLQ